MPSTSVTRPPIPQAPLVDPQSGYVTREWWRWFASIGTASLATTSSITTINNNITNIVDSTQPISLVDDPTDAADVMRLALRLQTPGEGVGDLNDVAKRALRFIAPAEPIGPQLDDLLRKVLELVRPIDQVAAPADPLQQLELAVPADPLPTDQLMLMARMLASPYELPSSVVGSVLVGTRSGWAASRVLSLSPSGYPNLTKYTVFDASGNTFEIVNNDLNAPRILLTAFDNNGTNSAFPTFNVRYSRGTAALPTAVQSGDILCTLFAAAGYGTTDFQGTSGRFRAIALQNFSDTVAGTEIRAQCTAVGTVGGTLTDVADFKASGCWFLGTNTNDNAAAGVVGEYVEATAAAFSLTTATTTNFCSISLTAGDWEVFAVAGFRPTTGLPTDATAWISTTSATNPGSPNGGAFLKITGAWASINPIVGPVGGRRISLSATTTVYLSGFANFPNTCTAEGHLWARRVR